MAVVPAYLDSRSYFRTPLGADAIDLGSAKIVPPPIPKLESPETIANRKRVTANLNGKAA